jgi:hypothetical protein
MMRLSKRVELVNAIDALTGGVVQDRVETGKLILGYLITLRGTSAAAAPINVITALGQFIIRSSAGASLVSEQNMGFLAERTRRQIGSIQWLQSAAIADPIMLSFFHSFDIAGGAHGNVYPVGHGDTIEIVLPAVAAAVVQAGTTWEVSRVSVDRGKALYLPRYHGRAFNLAELRYTLAGKTAGISIQPASVTPPTRVSVFSANEERLMFLPWNVALCYSNIFGNYGPAEATEVTYEHYSDSPDSITKCFGNTTMTVELIGGAGTCQISHCVVEPFPATARNLADNVSVLTNQSQMSRVALNGGPAAPGAATALATASSSMESAPGPSSAATKISDGAGSFSAPVPKVTVQSQSASLGNRINRAIAGR